MGLHRLYDDITHGNTICTPVGERAEVRRVELARDSSGYPLNHHVVVIDRYWDADGRSMAREHDEKYTVLELSEWN
jgi:hypothetical protein